MLNALQLQHAYMTACMTELEALKPGNVHVFADGHGMVVQDFIKSAEVSSMHIAKESVFLGERIYSAFNATWQAVHCNTNLGIVLLCAPIIQAALDKQNQPLLVRLTQVLTSTTQADAQSMFNAIALANPAGLGSSGEHDVLMPAQCTLLQAMQAAAHRDLIALQYSNQFNEVITMGLPHYTQALQRWQSTAWATSALYLFWLAHFKDSHVQRKYGADVADALQKQAQIHELAFLKHQNPKLYMPTLLAFDMELKSKGINPGTSADLTVVTLLLNSVHNLMLNKN